jgi:hypothetical protein
MLKESGTGRRYSRSSSMRKIQFNDNAENPNPEVERGHHSGSTYGTSQRVDI